MAYLDVKKQFIKLTGRFDLVVDTTNYVSATPFGVDDVIQAGQRLLDSMTTRRKEFSWERKDIASGDYRLNVSNTRAIKEVWLSNADGRVMLDKRSLGWLREKYAKPAASQTTAKPKYWAPAVNSLSPNQANLTAVGGGSPYTAEFTYDADDIVFGDHFAINTVLFFPVSDAVYTLSVLGKFFEATLSDDTDTNYWTEVYPDVLVKAGMLILERYYRNTEGVQDHLNDIRLSIGLMESDLIDEEYSGLNQQKG